MLHMRTQFPFQPSDQAFSSNMHQKIHFPNSVNQLLAIQEPWPQHQHEPQSHDQQSAQVGFNVMDPSQSHALGSFEEGVYIHDHLQQQHHHLQQPQLHDHHPSPSQALSSFEGADYNHQRPNYLLQGQHQHHHLQQHQNSTQQP
ncbi:sex-determining region Y protein-like [Impatiens glandulifera]|uniref:sex-determining region Y protein-like n=1 Tax=Impatiens glandulifera TaxID=253017 RepID=UPI001FB14615|nr:sex-determining region Y protein-like [Impatiens glandulifera]